MVSRSVITCLKSVTCLPSDSRLGNTRKLFFSFGFICYTPIFIIDLIFPAGHGSRAVKGMNCLRSLDAVIAGSNPTRGMDVFMLVRFSVFVLSFVVEALRWADHSS
jgi:hypothetical protein